ncbi:Kelch repeats protein, putative [Talaromyces stipitatus ATCC 10500]|uniref:Kelch repeats protein, putative n=1 Tax=Talaromyces stipitatus (strain ATCC 10500 / CBS 375.48 / QM 6759 / NRRL 1006) TaxID=441959 RepID=B8LYU1_TALSN|nr:Kelch repeats protein, putative [Talaromyces stipitatus ATCC 10500]EED23449.1 Kelch repeats protein, putative [Talaromyces stipitatus ATCC 10500]
MAKKDKKKSAEKKERNAAKQLKKADKKEKKNKSKGKDVDSDAEDVDLDAVLAAYAEEQAKFLKVTEVPSNPPSPRSSSTILASPANRNELLVFGGEYFDGTLATFFNNLYVYLIDRREWREVTSPNSPLPRSGHAWCRGGNAGGVYLFGGEFSSPKQGTFYHYNDFWHLDPATREWTRLEPKGKGPPARSGHRMTYYKNYIILFGGFQDTSQQTKYLQDLWIYDCTKFVWFNPVLPAASQKPDARSSFSFLPHESGAVLYGGYSRVKASTGAGGGGKQGKGAGGPQRVTLKPMVHQDTWFLRITPPAADAPASTGPTVRWERRKKPANAPNPPRAGVTMAYHKGRGIMFGGVHDIEMSEEGIDSEFFDTMFAWNLERNRFFPLTLRRPKAHGKKQQTQAVKARDRSKADEEDLLRNLAALEAKRGIRTAYVDEDNMDIDSPVDKEEVELVKPEIVKFEMPHRRFNAQLTVQDDTLFVFGGTFERGDQEFIFNDMYSIDLVKLDGVKEIFYNEPANWNTQVEASDDEDEEEDDDEDMDEDEDEAGEAMSVDTPSEAQIEFTVPSITRDMQQLEVEETEGDPETKDDRPQPRPFESLRDFFVRTTAEWQNYLLEKLKQRGDPAEKTVKELRKEAFDLAEEKWWDSREEIMALEDEQEAAGIGEVVSMADRAEGGGAGRRR